MEGKVRDAEGHGISDDRYDDTRRGGPPERNPDREGVVTLHGVVLTSGDAGGADPVNRSGATGSIRSTASGMDHAAGWTAAVLACNEVLRRGVDGLLRSVPEVAAVREYADPEQVNHWLSQDRPDVVVVAAADTPWLPTVRVLSETEVSILVLVDQTSINELPNYASPRSGGFLWQPALTSTALRDAMLRCQRGEVPVPPELVRALIGRDSQQRHRARPAGLTDRERQVVSLLVRGMSNKQIAKRLSISSHGAKRLVASVMLKLDAPNRTLAAVTAIREGLVDETGEHLPNGR
jgi:two-component system, NarL family, nitrate/nitrite response regulator NarL